MSSDCEQINPYGHDGRHKSQQVEAMFDNIAPAYDFMNRAMTLGIDKSWRKLAVNLAAREESSKKVLDVATGTGDLAIALAKAIPRASVIGIDLSEKMLEEARKKVAEAGIADRVVLMPGDCLSLPFDDATMDVVTVAFGVRNFENLERGLAEMRRVLRPDGRLIMLELSVPQSRIVRPLYQIYTRGVIPMVGRMVSKDTSAYSYLPASIAAVPQGDDMVRLIRNAGFKSAVYRPLTFGVCTLYVGQA